MRELVSISQRKMFPEYLQSYNAKYSASNSTLPDTRLRAPMVHADANPRI
jgi:hypothetical protein